MPAACVSVMPSSDTVKVVDQFLQPSGVCGKGLNSPLEIIRVGTGERNAARPAGFVRANSRLPKNPVIVLSSWLFGCTGV
jgi:hypothetical protein